MERGMIECILNLKTADGTTIKDYLISLLETLWKKQEEFSAKRPFGNSDWSYDLYIPLAEAGIIDTNNDEMDTDRGYEIILEVIRSLR